MGIDQWKTREVLKNTDFEHLANKFEISGYENFRMFKPLVYGGDLLSFLKDFESDNEKRFQLAGIISNKVKEGNKSIELLIKPFIIGAVILFILLIIYILTLN